MLIGVLLRRTCCVLLLFAACDLLADTQQLASAFLRLPYGNSQWTLSVQPARKLNLLQITYIPSPSCPMLAARLEVQDADSGVWQATSYNNGLFQTNQQRSAAVHVNFTQNLNQWIDCQVTVNIVNQAPELPGQNPALPGHRVYAGLLEYKGGFQQNLDLELNRAYFAQYFEIIVPQYCQNLEIISAAALRTDQVIESKQWGGGTRIWRLPQAGVFEQVRLDLNGPNGINCQVPIYVYDQTP
ncbi:MAG: hypothetical protein NTX25_06440 [Proteobacteria bacterium]|nr:hypothetical protein [Pseudomonadota bacterium]